MTLENEQITRQAYDAAMLVGRVTSWAQRWRSWPVPAVRLVTR